MHYAQGIELEDAGGVVSYCEILRSTIHDIGSTNLEHGMYIQGSHNLIDGDTLYNTYGLGIQVHKEGGVNGRDASYNIVRDCLIHNSGVAGSQPSLGLFVGDGNQAYNNVTLNFAWYIGRQLVTAQTPIEERWLNRLQFDFNYKF